MARREHIAETQALVARTFRTLEDDRWIRKRIRRESKYRASTHDILSTEPFCDAARTQVGG